MRIAFLINSLWNAGGTERMTCVIAGELVRRGHTVDVISIHAGKSFFDLDPDIEILNITRCRESSLAKNYIPYWHKLRKILRRKRYDFLIDVCTAMSLLSIPAAAGMETKIISWEHFNADVDWNPFTSPAARKLAARFAHRVVVLTATDCATFSQRFGATNVLRIPNPVTINTGDQRSELKIKRLLSVGRFTPQKGFDMLITSWARSQARHDGWILQIVGSGEGETSMREQIKALDLEASVEILPPQRDMVKIYREASVYVMSSRFEGLPLVLIEAMAMGLPIVSFDCPTGPRDIIENTVTGLLVPPDDIDLLAAAIDRVASDWDNRVSMGNAALVRSRLFSLPAVVDQWEAILI